MVLKQGELRLEDISGSQKERRLRKSWREVRLQAMV
jgi:hypothetical protein